MSVEEFHAAVIRYCLILNASVTSYGRTATHNAAVGGVVDSPHLVWLAADLVYDEAKPEALRRKFAVELHLRLVVEPDHDHLQPESWKRP